MKKIKLKIPTFYDILEAYEQLTDPTIPRDHEHLEGTIFILSILAFVGMTMFILKLYIDWSFPTGEELRLFTIFIGLFVAPYYYVQYKNGSTK